MVLCTKCFMNFYLKTTEGDSDAEVKAAMEALETVRRVMKESGQSKRERERVKLARSC